MWAGRADNQGLCWSRPRRKRQQPHREGASGEGCILFLQCRPANPSSGSYMADPPPPAGACYRGSYNQQAWDNRGVGSSGLGAGLVLTDPPSRVMLVVCRAKRKASGLPLATDVYVPHRKFITEPCRNRRELKTVNFFFF